MPPRGRLHKATPISYGMADPTESHEARLKRLRPDSIPNQVATSATSGARMPTAPTPPPVAATVATRKDANAVRNLRRGSVADATDGADTDGMWKLIDELLRDRTAATGVAVNSSLVKTWHTLHACAHRGVSPSVPVLPVTPRILVAVAALFKRGGYRSFPNYLSAIKARHIEAEHSWTELLAHTGAWVTRSVLRGIGPARQSCSFDFPKLCRLPRSPDALVTGGPQQPVHLALLSCAFLLREVEASTAKANAWTFDHDRSELSWMLPTSKSDPMALGISRCLGCLCGVEDFCCPYHVALDHWSWLRLQPCFRKPDCPLFPTALGTHAPKTTVVDTFETLGAMIGQPTFNPDGMRRFGGHTPRVTGSQAYAVLGIEVNKIRILARHSGDVILRYVADAPLRSLRADLGLSSAGRPASASLPSSSSKAATPQHSAKMTKRIRALEASLEKLRKEMLTQAQDVVALATGFARTDQRIFIMNTVTACVHFARHHDEGHTACGWPFARVRRTASGPAFRIINNLVDIPGSMMCDGCLPTEKAVALAAIHGDMSGDDQEEPS